ncbi:hypothetical protein [Aquimarina sp. 2201CG5-10]|uniref:hypothetical protein n=1 Tax=Aquimarina callyspongiae TaxID=3098150 RepID=UPI002AB4DB61|nr:hypothetical protein [Aquimarina sp. 2201CG5-10]MDY8136213.1 hypothetical protein [Aquimarina sp. 2201CG5-10]
MSKKILKLETARKLSREEQRSVNGGRGLERCSGSGTGGVSTVGYSQACVGKANGTRCTINGYQAGCTGIGGGFWFY